MAPPQTAHPTGPPSDDWSLLGAADDSTLPVDDTTTVRLRLHDTSGASVLPLESTAVWIPDLGIYGADVEIHIDRTDVITVRKRRN